MYGCCCCGVVYSLTIEDNKVRYLVVRRGTVGGILFIAESKG